MQRAKELLLDKLSPILAKSEEREDSSIAGVRAMGQGPGPIPIHHGSEEGCDLNDLEMKEFQMQKKNASIGKLSRCLETVTWFLQNRVKVRTSHATESVRHKWSNHL